MITSVIYLADGGETFRWFRYETVRLFRAHSKGDFVDGWTETWFALTHRVGGNRKRS